MIILRMCKSMMYGILSNPKLDVNVLVLGYQMEMMKIWNFYDVSE
jgi:hypothetical protein